MDQSSTGSTITVPGDARVTLLGRFLRASCIDELPQLINILVGDMTLVGPRPQTLVLAAQYPEDAARVLEYRPGLTGPGVLRLNDEDVLPASSHEVENFYFRWVVPERAALDLQYLTDPTLRKTVLAIVQSVLVPLRVFRPAPGVAPITFSLRPPESFEPVSLRAVNADESMNADALGMTGTEDLEIDLTTDPYPVSKVATGAVM